MRLISVTRDTSHAWIGPCGPLEHSPLGDSLRHVSTARLSCTLDCGENARFGVGGAMIHDKILSDSVIFKIT